MEEPSTKKRVSEESSLSQDESELKSQKVDSDIPLSKNAQRKQRKLQIKEEKKLQKRTFLKPKTKPYHPRN
jgi:hypothetical protein